jgi:hypothetical protein
MFMPNYERICETYAILHEPLVNMANASRMLLRKNEQHRQYNTPATLILMSTDFS